LSIVADSYRFVVGVDTHAATHTLALIEAGSGARRDQAQFPTSPAGLNRAVAWISRRTAGESALIAIEGTGSYGATLTSHALDIGLAVVEPPRPAPRRGSKNDTLDAASVADSVRHLKPSELTWPRATTGIRAGLRVLLVARDQMTTHRTAVLNALTALVRTHQLGIDARRPLTSAQLQLLAAMRTRPAQPWHLQMAAAEAKRLAIEIATLDQQLAANHKTLATAVSRVAAHLMAQYGFGPVTTAQILVSYSHHGRFRSEAAFATLAGVAPIEASSGNTTSHRLNPFGDRQLNRALHVIAKTRIDAADREPRTQAYCQRRRAEGLSERAIRRCLKRYIARATYRQLQHLTLA
jgi:transposase